MRRAIVVATLIGALSGCTIHPLGEARERQAADLQGRHWLASREQRLLPTLSNNPTANELVRYALLRSPDLEQRYWEWRSAIEQVPQDGTQATNLILSAGMPITRGSTAFNRTTITVANDPMADIVWPSKLGTAAARALDSAKAAGYRFQKAQYALRQQVLDAYYDYQFAVQQLLLDREDLEILSTAAAVVDANISPGKSTQSDSMMAQNEVDLLKNQIVEDEARVPLMRVALNIAIGRDPAAEMNPDISARDNKKLIYAEDQLLKLALDRNPDLKVVDAESRGRDEAIHLAKLQYLPDFSISISSDLAGNVQNLLGTLTVPLFRYQAINAAIAQAESNWRSTEAMRLQTQLDLRGRVVADVSLLDGMQKQLDLLDSVILPRATQNAEIIQSSYEGGRAFLPSLFDAQRAAIAIKRVILRLKIDQQKIKADLAAITAAPIET